MIALVNVLKVHLKISILPGCVTLSTGYPYMRSKCDSITKYFKHLTKSVSFKLSLVCCLSGGARALDIFTNLSMTVGVGDDGAEEDIVDEREALDPRLEFDAAGGVAVFLALEVFIDSLSCCVNACCFF